MLSSLTTLVLRRTLTPVCPFTLLVLNHAIVFLIVYAPRLPFCFLLADDHGHGHHHPAYEEPKTFADYVKPEYWYR